MWVGLEQAVTLRLWNPTAIFFLFLLQTHGTYERRHIYVAEYLFNYAKICCIPLRCISLIL